MQNKSRLDASLALLGASAPSNYPEDFFDGVWQRVGQLQERAEQRLRIALFCGLIFVGLGAGVGATQLPASAHPISHKLIAGDEFSPSALLHI